MTDDRRLQFQVGMVILLALSLGTAMVFRFGELYRYWQPRYSLWLELEHAGGLYPGAPVLMHGLRIGFVERIQFAPGGGVLAELAIRDDVRLPSDSRALMTRALLGDTAIELLRGRSAEMLRPGSKLPGESAEDPLAMVQRLEARAVKVLDSFAQTSQEWQRVGGQINRLMNHHQHDLDQIVVAAAQSLQQFTTTLQATQRMVEEAHRLVSDPRSQQALKETMQGLPWLVEETRATIVSARATIDTMNRNLVNLAQITEPLGQKGQQIVLRLDESLSNLEGLLEEFHRFAILVNQSDGTLSRFARDPALYEHLDQTALSLGQLVKNLEPVMRDLREFSDKIARNPELLGVGGAVRPSSGLKDSELLNHPRPRPTRAQSP
ncbi:MAG: hypothetical protein KatS3mg113_1001 [Planctomycetaceae bacterium]|nr:MAG: hypothetical protein KatS3mg113_1001 [Planctomycetaceae bacterium]